MSKSFVKLTQLPSENGIAPVKKTAFEKFEAKAYTDTTLALEFVGVETKNRQIDTITQ